jgi:1-acyl-sn-glycerol-3-phosphate acyltransferase
MFRFLPAPVKGVVTAVLVILNTIVWCLLLYPFAILKFLMPMTSVQRACNWMMTSIGQNWISGNSFMMAMFHRFQFEVTGLDGLRRDRSYLVSANHQSWVDIVFLQETFNRRIPFLRFFLKSELIWVPFLGLA